MTSLPKFLALFAGLGLLIPFVFKVLSPLVNSADSIYYATHAALILFPSSILNLAASPDDPSGANKLFMLSTLINVLFYTLIGLLAWLGLRKHYGFFILLALMLVGVWWRIQAF